MCATRSTSSIAPTSSTKVKCSKKDCRAKSSAIAMYAGFISANASRYRPGRARVMALTQRLEIRQGQSLVMTPQLQQAIKLLQLSNIELTQYVEQELERNPLLERDERDQGPIQEPTAEAPSSGEPETLDAGLTRE